MVNGFVSSYFRTRFEHCHLCYLFRGFKILELTLILKKINCYILLLLNRVVHFVLSIADVAVGGMLVLMLLHEVQRKMFLI